MTTGTNYTAILFFFLFVGFTMVITYWAAKQTKTTEHFYAAGRSISGFQNGLALAGDYMSAASFLGIAGLVALNGFDGLIYSTGWLVGWPIILFLIAEPLRNLGRYTFTDVVAYRLQQKPVRVASAIGTMAVVLTYLIAQMVGSGTLIQLLFGLNYTLAVIIVGVVMMTYVLFGGMIATTWVQIIKALLLLGGATVMALLVLAKFGFNPIASSQAAQRPDAIRTRRRVAVVLLRPKCAGAGHQGGDRSLGRRLARHGADVRHSRPAAYPDALLHRAERQGGARFGDVGDDLDRLLLSRHLHPRLRLDGAGRTEGHPGGRRRRQHGGAAARPGARRQRLLRLHLRRRLRHDPGGGRRPDPRRRRRALARPVGERGARRPCTAVRNS